ncbi:MAG: AMP-binding protein [Bacillota bacterium]|nr:AMP-binding protein [Bacillota bacterium]
MKNPPLTPVVYYETFGRLLEAMEAYDQRPAISFFARDRSLQTRSYSRLCLDVRRLAAALRHHGLEGKHVGLAGENSYHWLVAFLAVVTGGGTAVCVDVEQPRSTIREMLSLADTEVLIASPSSLPLCLPASEGASPFLRTIVMEGAEGAVPAPAPDSELWGLAELLEQGDALLGKEGFVPPALSPGRRALIAFTSGTTSASKPVSLSHRNLLTNACDSSAMVAAPTEVFTALPCYHTYGLTCGVLGNLGRGAHVTINGSLKTTLPDLRESGALVTTTVPLLVESLYKYLWLCIERAGKKDRARRLLKRSRTLDALKLLPAPHRELRALCREALGPLEMIVCGGAHLDKELIENFRMFGVLSLQGYGITECSPLVSVNRECCYDTATVGQVLPHCQVRLVDEEIWVRGDGVMEGYYNSPELTAEVFEDGWFKTGDLGYIDEKGFLSITGRQKNLIVFKNGKKVSPEKVEEQLYRIPLVGDVIVYGAASGTSADDVKLAVSIWPDPEASKGLAPYEILNKLQQEVDRINAALPSYQQIQMINIRDSEFSKTSTAKIKRHAL